MSTDKKRKPAAMRGGIPATIAHVDSALIQLRRRLDDFAFDTSQQKTLYAKQVEQLMYALNNTWAAWKKSQQ